MSDSLETIKTSHALDGDTRKLETYYADWAKNYDEDVSDQGYGGPRVSATLAALVASSYEKRPRRSLSVLDAGCGTGLVAAELAKLGFKDIDGFDLSEEMVEVARRTGHFGKLASGIDLNTDQPSPFTRQYDIVTCCGVFTLGHVEPDGLKRLAAYLRPGGHLIASTRLSYYEGTDFEATSERFSKDGTFEFLFTVPGASYIDEEGAHYWVYRKPA